MFFLYSNFSCQLLVDSSQGLSGCKLLVDNHIAPRKRCNSRNLHY
nr:MAG TPA: hypothetical protein [Caudoviricetes sp.]DAM81748.1 MAG TPA: hypothetical protein [Caudoviricetes sp.]